VLGEFSGFDMGPAVIVAIWHDHRKIDVTLFIWPPPGIGANQEGAAVHASFDLAGKAFNH
jgi:hypothetical protein